MVGLAVAAIAAGCIKSPAEPQEQMGPEPTSVTIAPDPLATKMGRVERFLAEVFDAEGQPIYGTIVTWATTNPSVAVVDHDGYVWAFSEGQATATADFPGKDFSSANGNAYGHSSKDTYVTVSGSEPTLPEQVTDLAVTSATTTSVTLTFTEVGDGTGAVADYVIRGQEAPFDWGRATDVKGTCSPPFAGGILGGSRSCTVSDLAPSTDYQFQLVAFRGTYPSEIVHGSLSNVASGSTPASPDPTAQPQPPGGVEGHPNEPAGFHSVSARSFDVVGEHGWYDRTDDDNYSVGVADTQAPSSHVGRVRFWKGMTGGRSPVSTATRLDFSPRSNVYVSFWLKLDANWQGHQSGVNKILFITDPSYGGGGDPVYIAAYGGGDGPLELQIRLQGPYDEGSLGNGSANLRPNTGNGELIRGQWHHVELLLRMNKESQNDGTAIGWLDGRKVIEYTDVKYIGDSGAVHSFDNVRWGPVWGGVDDVIATDMYMFLDDFYVATSDS